MNTEHVKSKFTGVHSGTAIYIYPDVSMEREESSLPLSVYGTESLPPCFCGEVVLNLHSSMSVSLRASLSERNADHSADSLRVWAAAIVTARSP